MDLRAYYRKIRTIEAGISEPVVVIISRETSDGGKSGIRTDVLREVAARLIAEDKADLASPEQAAQFRSKVEARWRSAERIAMPRPQKKS